MQSFVDKLARAFAWIPAGAFALLLGALWASSARAHSLPYGVALSWADPASSALPLIVTNRGLVFAEGATEADGFSIRCNEAYGSNTSDRPLAYLLPSGTLTLGIYNRVFQTWDRGCTLTPSTGIPESSVSSLVSPASAPQRMYVGTRVLTQQAGIYASDDSGRTFSQQFTSAVDSYYETIVVAPSDPQRLYAFGLHYDRVNLQVIFYASVSLDGGKNWEDTVTPARITPLAVHPSKPDVLFAYRATDKYETNFDILRSDDRGKNYKVVLPNVYLPTGFAAVGSTLYLGMSFRAGLYQSHDDGQSFQPLLADQVQRITCLAEHGNKLWLCANIAPNLDAIWVLKDDASGVDKVMSFEAVRAPVTCASASANEICALPWHDFDFEVHPPADDAGVALDGGAPADAEAESADADADADAGDEVEPDPDNEPDEGDEGDEPGEDEPGEDEDASVTPRSSRRSGCQCGLSAKGERTGAWLALLGLVALGYRRARARHRLR